MDKFLEDVKKGLTNLSDGKKALFAALNCEKLYPNYVRFSAVEGWGDSQVVEQSINLMYEYSLRQDLIDAEEVQEVLDKFYEVFPDMDDFESLEVSFAFDACTAIENGLFYLLEHDDEKVMHTSATARDTVDMYVQIRDDVDPNDPAMYAKLDANPLIVAELNRQKALIKQLTTLEEITNESIQALKKFNSQQVIIDISLLPQ